jgi:hypothetical protein
MVGEAKHQHQVTEVPTICQAGEFVLEHRVVYESAKYCPNGNIHRNVGIVSRERPCCEARFRAEGDLI